jgi:hypothetical protein
VCAGTGKTLLARALACNLNASFLKVRAACLSGVIGCVLTHARVCARACVCVSVCAFVCGLTCVTSIFCIYISICICARVRVCLRMGARYNSALAAGLGACARPRARVCRWWPPQSWTSTSASPRASSARCSRTRGSTSRAWPPRRGSVQQSPACRACLWVCVCQGAFVPWLICVGTDGARALGGLGTAPHV